MTIEKSFQNSMDYIALQRKYFSLMQSSLISQAIALLKGGIFALFFGKKKRLLKAQKDTNKLLEKFNRIPETFVTVFDQDSYLYANIDIKDAIEAEQLTSALEHFILYGYEETKRGDRRIGNAFPLFNESDYLRVNPDVKAAIDHGGFKTAFEHFLLFGYSEFMGGLRGLTGTYPFEWTDELQRAIKKDFNEAAYLEANNDVDDAVTKGLFESGWDHFVKLGVNEVKRGERQILPSIPPFSECEYVQHNRDVFEALAEGSIISPFEHFLMYGMYEMLEGIRKSPKGSMYIYLTPKFSETIEEEIKSFEKKPLISVIMPVYNVDPQWIEKAIDSLEAQWYGFWELCIADDASTNEETLEFLKSVKNDKIKIEYLKQNQNISGASNSALALAEGEYIALMDNDDELTPDALYEVVKVINEYGAEFVYSDEDKLDMNGRFIDPHFKADFAPDMFLSQNYMSHLGVIKKSLVETVGGWEVGLEGSQDYDLYLKVLEKTEKVFHIPKVLYHWRKIPGSTASEFSGKSYAQEAGRKALENALERREIKAKAENGILPGTYRVRYTEAYDTKIQPLISIIIPFKDKPDLLKMCVGSIVKKSTYKNYEIIGISNNSEEIQTFETMDNLSKKFEKVRFYEYNQPFNYSAINNYAVNNYAKGKHIILLNNDIEIITSEWIETLLEFSERKDIGTVGAKLYYPNDTVQHAGVIIGIGGVAGHSHKYFDRSQGGYFSRLNIVQNVSAVTAACMMIKASIYREVGGLNEKDLQIAFNDVDFCLRVREKGYRNIFTPYCEAYHHESISRGAEDNPEKVKRFNKEIQYMENRHKEILNSGDPFYNVNLTLEHENFYCK